MRYLPETPQDERLLVGINQADDGAVYQLTEDLAMIQTVDFFTPVVDDPYAFGQIAAANSLSDVYAMGGQPKTVLNIVAYPMKDLGPEILAEILRGSGDKVKEAGAIVVGGHSIDDQEPKFGLSVTGLVHPKKFYKNTGAKPGDKLVITKPLGIGIQTTALKREKLSKKQIQKVTEVMGTLNKFAAESLNHFNPNAVTDVTGFGLLGHAFEMAKGSEVSFVIDHQMVPVLEGTYSLAKENIIPGGSRANYRWLIENVSYSEQVSEVDQIILCDAITSGGLLISLPEKEAEKYVKIMNEHSSLGAQIIGEVDLKKKKTLYVI